MKKIYNSKICFLLLILFITSACDDYLDVESETAVSSESVFQSQDGVLFALTGVYTRLKLKGFYGTEFALIGDAATDNGKIPSDRESAGANADRMPFAYTLNLNTTNTSTLWQDAYIVINNINNILENIDNATDINEDVRSQVIAEGRILRAWAYFSLVQLYSQDFNFTADQSHPGVPIVIATGIEDQPVRNTVGEVFNFIFTEMNESISVLQNNDAIGRDNDIYFLNYFSAVAMRAKMHFYVTNYAEALADADIVISQGPYSLVENYTTSLYEARGLGDLEFIDAWAGTVIVESESIFQLYVNEDNPEEVTTNRSIIDIYTSNNGNAAHAISNDLLSLYEAGDVRTNWYKIEDVDPHVFKYPGGFGDARDDTPYSVLRLTEFILMKAECEVRVNNADNVARDLVNLITLRAGASPIASSGNALIEDIITERRKEMAFEGNRLFDLKRLQRGFTRVDCILPENCTVVYPSNLYAWPIPQDELNGNPNIRQNDGY
ncbi:RagB/SusD family nutrient uptake outer membrane protein [Fulvivirgaceae bacterium BMA12]|uniref:RagB/SusD family nutrient uptake outer membrane protein n=1 Tax=Agaribacillus aureus TaxID=3051825 RepID=A0ABT8KZU0_9BACT|nr:RagB/SusD family nutrient uptake outer membrane protein [Fulvivirgaceae bacterium BMA12]